jgi:DNA-binding response OmpR family regulator
VQEFAGTGLGLPIVQSLVHMHGGRIWATSQPGQGSTFSFTVPQSEPGKPSVEIEELDEEEELPAIAALSREVASHVPRILVVEDDPDIAALIARNLTQVGYIAETVGTGKKAIERIKADPPDLVTLDIYLPDIDGLKVLRALKEDPLTADVPVVVVSVMPENKESLRLGAIDYLTKPIDAAALIEVISRVLGQTGCVLVVEDDLDTSKMVTETLQRAGLRVLVTANGKHALSLAKDEQPDLILLDLKLPRMDGYTVLHNLKQVPATADIPVMIMTGSVVLDEAKRQEFMNLGAASLLAKPFEVKTLLAQIETLLKLEHTPGRSPDAPLTIPKS